LKSLTSNFAFEAIAGVKATIMSAVRSFDIKLIEFDLLPEEET